MSATWRSVTPSSWTRDATASAPVRRRSASTAHRATRTSGASVDEHGITGLQGGLAEVLVLPAVNAVRRGHALPAEQAALTEPLACILHAQAAVRRGHDLARYRLQTTDVSARVRTVVIAGAGPAGLLFLQHLRQVEGFEGRILVSEPSPTRQALALHYGADTVIDPMADDVVEADADADRWPARRVPDRRLWAAPRRSARCPDSSASRPTVPPYAHAPVRRRPSGSSTRPRSASRSWRSPVGASGGSRHLTDGRRCIVSRSKLPQSGRVDVSRIVTNRHQLVVLHPRSDDPAAADYVKGVTRQRRRSDWPTSATHAAAGRSPARTYCRQDRCGRTDAGPSSRRTNVRFATWCDGAGPRGRARRACSDGGQQGTAPAKGLKAVGRPAPGRHLRKGPRTSSGSSIHAGAIKAQQRATRSQGVAVSASPGRARSARTTA